MKRAILCLALATTATTAGCTSSSRSAEASPGPSTRISSQQVKALADKRVTWDEYTTAYNAYGACLAKAGYSISHPVVKDDLYDGGIPAAAMDDGTYNRCYDYFWSQVDSAWQISHEDTSYSARFIINCLTENRLPHKPKYTENLAILEQHHVDLETCPAYDDGL